jgi:hypothetical protein
MRKAIFQGRYMPQDIEWSEGKILLKFQVTAYLRFLIFMVLMDQAIVR